MAPQQKEIYAMCWFVDKIFDEICHSYDPPNYGIKVRSSLELSYNKGTKVSS